MSAHHEPRFARVAAMVADPARSRMLAYLLAGHYASAGELAKAASVSAATASGHLAKLLAEGFLHCEPRGRHRYYCLADASIAHLLEAMALVAERNVHEEAWNKPGRQTLRAARCCYGHLAGKLGVQLFETLLQRDCLVLAADGFALSTQGNDWLQGLGLSPSAPIPSRRYAYRCLDWSERRDHLAGQLADELLQHCLHRDWLQPAAGRSLQLSEAGRRELLPQLLPLPG